MHRGALLNEDKMKTNQRYINIKSHQNRIKIEVFVRATKANI